MNYNTANGLKLKFKTSPSQKALDELNKNGITVYDKMGNAINSPVTTVKKTENLGNNTNLAPSVQKASKPTGISSLHDKIGDTIASAKKLVGEQINNSPYKDILPTPKKLNTAESIKSTREPLKNTTEPKKSIGYQIKDSITGQLYKKSPWSKSLYDKVDAYAIEKNIPAAQEAIDLNIKTGKLSKDDLPKYPYLRDGLAFSYAAGEVGNKKAEKAARELAYTKRDSSSYIKPAGWVLANDSIDINRTKESTPPVSASPDPSKTFSVKDWKKIQNNYNSNKTAKFGNVSQNTTVYYGELNLGNKGEDLKYSDYTDDELTKILGITKMDLKYSERTHLFIFKDLASKTSVGDMEDVILDMIDHFADGTGTDYQNEVLTKAVEKHSETQRYMNDFTDVFKTQFELNNGDIESVADSNNIHDALRNQGVLLSKYDYFGIGDIFGGLTMAVHSWTESEVKVTDININDDGTYNGVLEFTFKDNFGLDKDDVEKYWVIPGFKNWFILQHSNQYKEKYKPFKTVVRIYKKFDGKIEGYKQ